MIRYRHLTLPGWMEIRRGQAQGSKSNYIRIDSVWISINESEPIRLTGSIVAICRDSVTTKRTVHASTIRFGVRPLWLLERNGLGGLLTVQRPKAQTVSA
jgi:hypothetical protein